MSAFFALATFSKCTRELQGTHELSTPGKNFGTAGLHSWTPFQACVRIRLHTHVNGGLCTFCRCDPAKDSRELHCDHQSLMSEHQAQTTVTEALCCAPSVACHISAHRPRGCWRDVTHDKGTPGPQTPPCPTAVHQIRHIFFVGCRNSHLKSLREPPKSGTGSRVSGFLDDCPGTTKTHARGCDG